MIESTSGFEIPASSTILAKIQSGAISPAHPTSHKFDPAEWCALGNSYAGDADVARLIPAALWLGNRIAALRHSFDPVFPPLTREQAIRATIGFANASFHYDGIAFDREHRAAMKKSGIYSPSAAKAPVYSEHTDQHMDMDSLVTTSVDALPHLLFIANRISNPSAGSREEFNDMKSFNFGNFESVYRGIWQQCLWNGYSLRNYKGDIYLDPCSKAFAALWPAWDHHRQMRVIDRFTLAGYGFLPTKEKEDFSQFLPTRIPHSMVWREGQWRFRTEGASALHEATRRSAMMAISVRTAGLESFFAQTFAKESGATFNDLIKAWIVIDAVGSLFQKKFPKNRPRQYFDNTTVSMVVRSPDLVDLLGTCCGMDQDRAAQCVKFLTVDATDTQRLFNKSVWDCPLVPVEGDELCIVHPAVAIGNFSRVFEHWIGRAQGASSPEIKGSSFEAALASKLQNIIQASELPCDVEVSAPCQWVGGEEVDCLCRVGDIVLVVEAKCFITPGDPIERFNFLKKLSSAAEQAKRKAHAASNATETVQSLFPALGATPIFLPVVIVPASYGVGTEFDGVPVLDQNYLGVLLTSTELHAGAAQVGDETHIKVVPLYPKGFTPAHFVAQLKRPYQVRRFIALVSESYEPFPSGLEKTKLFLHMPRVTGDIDTDFLSMIGGISPT